MRTKGSLNKSRIVGVQMSELQEVFKPNATIFISSEYITILNMNSIEFTIPEGKAPPKNAETVTPTTKAAKAEKNGKKVKKTTKKAEKKGEKIQFNILTPTAPEMATA